MNADVLEVQARQIAEMEAALAAAQDEQRRQVAEMGERVNCLREVLTHAEALLAALMPGG